jgi:PAS domain-containing protein
MSQRPIEVILTRQLASSLAMPMFLVDPDGTLLFYNEPAEAVLGMRFDETGEMPASEWATAWSPCDADGRPLPAGQLPLMIAVAEHRPAHSEFWIRGMDGTRRHIHATAIPLMRSAAEILGGIVIFWEAPP